MQRVLSFLLIITLLAVGCRQSEDSTNCLTPTVSAYPDKFQVTFDLSSGGNNSSFDVEYGAQGYSQGSGTLASSLSTSYTATGLSIGTYDYYVRGNCGGSNTGNWSGPQTFEIDGSTSGCYAVYNDDLDHYNGVNFDNILDWYYVFNAGYFEVEYGSSGFTLGSGTNVVTNNEYYYIPNNSLTPGQVYDYYVRVNCGGSDFSKWAGPHSFVAD